MGSMQRSVSHPLINDESRLVGQTVSAISKAYKSFSKLADTVGLCGLSELQSLIRFLRKSIGFLN